MELGTLASCDLHHLSCLANIEPYIAALQVTTTLTDLEVDISFYQPSHENNRRVVLPICRCIANLRHLNQNHPSRKVTICGLSRIDVADRFLIAAKQYGIQHLILRHTHLPIQSLAEFCRGNTHLKFLCIHSTSLKGDRSSISLPSQGAPQDSYAVLTMDNLAMEEVAFSTSTVVTEFLNLMSRVTYPALKLGRLFLNAGQKEEDHKNARLRIVSALIKPTTVEELTLGFRCPFEVMGAIEACATVTQIQLDSSWPPGAFRSAAVQQKLQTITTRNRNLARFVVNPRRDYQSSDEDMLALMRQFDNSPTGRYILARCFPEIPSLFQDQEEH